MANYPGCGQAPVGVSKTARTLPLRISYTLAAICPLSLIAVAEKSQVIFPLPKKAAYSG